MIFKREKPKRRAEAENRSHVEPLWRLRRHAVDPVRLDERARREHDADASALAEYRRK